MLDENHLILYNLDEGQQTIRHMPDKDELAIGCMLWLQVAFAAIPIEIEEMRHGNDFSG